MKKLSALALFIGLAISTSGCSDSEKIASDAAAAAAAAEADAAAQAAADATNAAYYAREAAKKEAAVEADPSPTSGRKLTVDAAGCNVPNREDSEKFGLILNLNSLLCAKVVKVCSLKVRNALEVTCIEYRGGSATKTYIIDTKTAVAFEQ